MSNSTVEHLNRLVCRYGYCRTYRIAKCNIAFREKTFSLTFHHLIHQKSIFLNHIETVESNESPPFMFFFMSCTLSGKEAFNNSWGGGIHHCSALISHLPWPINNPHHSRITFHCLKSIQEYLIVIVGIFVPFGCIALTSIGLVRCVCVTWDKMDSPPGRLHYEYIGWFWHSCVLCPDGLIMYYSDCGGHFRK